MRCWGVLVPHSLSEQPHFLLPGEGRVSLLEYVAEGERRGKGHMKNFRMKLEFLIQGLPFATSGGLLWPSGVSLPADARAWLCGALITPARGGIV